jgi:hypothetical protein
MDPFDIWAENMEEKMRAKKRLTCRRAAYDFRKSVIVFERVSPNRFVPFTLLRSAKPNFHVC